MGVPQNIMRALCAVIRPDHFKFASYGPDNRTVKLSFLAVLSPNKLKSPQY